MPELPEVVTVTNILNEEVAGLKIKSCEIFWPRLIRDLPPIDFCKLVKGQRIQRVFNRAKYIIFELDNKVMISHLRMEGRWAYERPENHSYKETILEAEFKFENDDKVLRYYDLRRFGTLELEDKEEFLKGITKLNKIGPEANATHLTYDWLSQRLAKTHRNIKTVLLDQTIISGIGNIYANEILYAIGVNPHRPANELNEKEIKLLILHARLILNEAIVQKGTTIHSFEAKKHQSGNFQHFLQVHGKQGEACKNCKTLIVKEKVNGRGTYYCPNCQAK